MKHRSGAGFALFAWTGFAIALAGCSPGGTPAKESTPPKEELKTVAKESTPPATPAKKETAMPPAKTPATSPAPGQPHPALANPGLATEKAPDKFKARFTTTKGDFTLEVTRDWSPLGADRFYNLVKIGYFTDIAFFRVIDGFMAQFGIHGDPQVSAKWRSANIQDDPVKESNVRGNVTFATAGPNTRSTQFFINFGNNVNLDKMGFSPFAKVVEGMDIVDSIYKGYGEGAPRGRGPDQGRIQGEGNAYLKASFPNLDYIKGVTIVP
jgi:peptidyl-prolyl cis-trans isomerase A (cyclophilin A)